MRLKPVVGQTLYSLNVGNAARKTEQKLTPVIVTKVGRKYFTTGEGWNSCQYHLDDWCEKNEYSATSVVYESPQCWEDEKDCMIIRDTLRNCFGTYGTRTNFTLDQLKRISAIVNEVTS